MIGVSRDLMFGAACLAIAVGYYLMAGAIPESALSDTVGAQGLPKTYATVLAALSLILIVRSIALHREPDPSTGSGSPRAGSSGDKARPTQRSTVEKPRESDRWPVLRVAGMLGIGILYLIAVPWLGYILALAGLIAATTYYQGGGLNGRAAMVALSGALFFWVLFVAVLGIPHPPGIWPALF
jgi:hypothetical protein